MIKIEKAGVGSPIKELVCLSSMLKLANLYAAAKAIINPEKGIK